MFYCIVSTHSWPGMHKAPLLVKMPGVCPVILLDVPMAIRARLRVDSDGIEVQSQALHRLCTLLRQPFRLLCLHSIS